MTWVPAPPTTRRTGADYLAGLRDDRHVVLDGHRVDDVTRHPAFAEAARSVAAIYDLIAADTDGDLLATGLDGPTPRFFVAPGDAEDVVRRGRCFRAIARSSGGLLGRSPDFLGTLLTSWSAAHAVFGGPDSAGADRVVAHHREAARGWLCHTHAISDPPSPTGRDGRDLRLTRVARTPEGIVVNGTKMLATLAPFADEVLVYPFKPLEEHDSARALAFSVPVATPGLRILCRPGLTPPGPVADHPLSARFDEMDALCVFDDVLVPHERVFIDGDVELANALRPRTGMTAWLWHQSAVRAAVKAELVLGATSLVARATARRERESTARRLGEIAAVVEGLRALVDSAEAGAAPDPFGSWVPAWAPLAASGVVSALQYPHLVELLQLVGSSSLVMCPTTADLDAADARDAAASGDYVAAGTAHAHHNAAVLRLAGELAVGGFGGRQSLYERFYLGDPEALCLRFSHGADIAGAEGLVEGLLRTVQP